MDWSEEKQAWVLREIIRAIKDMLNEEQREGKDSALILAKDTWTWLVEMRKFFPLSSPIPDMEALHEAYKLRSRVRTEMLNIYLSEYIDKLDALPDSTLGLGYIPSQKDRFDAIVECRKIIKKC